MTLVNQKKTKRLFIGVPAYNAENLVLDALNSIKNQDFTNYDVLIIDNHSEDKTWALITKFCAENDQFHCSQNEVNIGVNANFRKLVKKAEEYEFFIWKAVDDKWSSNYLSSCISELDSNQSVGVTQGTVKAFDLVSGSLMSETEYPNLNKYQGFFSQSILFFRPHYNFFIYGMFRNNVMQSIIDDFHPIPSADRILFQYVLLLGWKVSWIEHCYYYRGKHLQPASDRYRGDPHMHAVELGKTLYFDFTHRKITFHSFEKFARNQKFRLWIVKQNWYRSKVNVGVRKMIKKSITLFSR